MTEFKPGDRVRYTFPGYIYPNHREAIIVGRRVDKDRDGYDIKFLEKNNGPSWGATKNLELVEDDAVESQDYERGYQAGVSAQAALQEAIKTEEYNRGWNEAIVTIRKRIPNWLDGVRDSKRTDY